MLELLFATSQACDWNNPGRRPYARPAVEALASYAMLHETRAELMRKMAAHQFDDVATITATEINGNNRYTGLRGMHFAGGRTCATVDRSRWGDRTERGLVYCAGDHCLIVPTVCGNVSIVDRDTTATSAMQTEGPAESEGAGYGAPQPTAWPSPTMPAQVPTFAALVQSPMVQSPLAPQQPAQLPPMPAQFQYQPMLDGPVYVVTVPAVPEPATWALWGLGLMFATGLRRAKGSNSD